MGVITDSGDICYFSAALPRCCPSIERNFEVGEGTTVTVGSEEVTVRYFYLGGFGFPDSLSECACACMYVENCNLHTSSACSCDWI